MAIILILMSFSASISPPLILVNLFREKLGCGLFGIPLYETVSTISIIIFSLPLLKVRKEHSIYMIILGLILLSLSNIILVIAKTLYLVLTSAFLVSLGYAVMDPFFINILFSKIPKDKKGSLLGGIAGIRKIINIMSLVLAGLLADTLSPSTPYLISTFALVACIPLVFYTTK